MPRAYFQDLARPIAAELALARHSVRLAVAWLTEPALLAALGAAARRGVAVEVIVSRSDLNPWQLLAELAAAGAEVLLWGTADSSAGDFLHHKFCVLDYETVITGSYNWSRNAARNAENITIAPADQALAAQYLAEFDRLLPDARPLLTEMAPNPARPSLLGRVLGRSRGAAFVLDAAATPLGRAAAVRLWASRTLGEPGRAATLHWQAPAGAQLALRADQEADPNQPVATETGDAAAPADPAASVASLPATGQQTVHFSRQPATFTLTATEPDGRPLAQRTLRLTPAAAPLIELFEVVPPTIVGALLTATLRWRVSQAETVRLEPGPADGLPGLPGLPLAGEQPVSPAASTIYTLVARGLGGERRQSLALTVFPVPVLGRLEVPALRGLRTEVQLSYANTPLPSGLDLRAARMPALSLPTLRQLRTELLPAALPRLPAPPTLAALAAAHSLASPAGLRWPDATVGFADPAGPAAFARPRWTGWRLAILDRLEPRFQANPRLSYLLSTIRKLYA